MATLYVRPDTTHFSGTRDGLSYQTAFGGLTEVLWNQLTAGSILYVCGEHILNSSFTIGVHGGSEIASVIISGEYSGDLGSIFFEDPTLMILNHYRPFTKYIGLNFHTTVNTSSAKKTEYIRCRFLTPKNRPGIYFYPDNNAFFTDFTIDNCTFTSIDTDENVLTNGNSIQWIPTNTNSTFNRLKIINCRFEGVNAYRSAIYIRIDPVAQALGAAMNDIEVINPTFVNCTGNLIEIAAVDSNYDKVTHSGVKIIGMTANDCKQSVRDFGGAIFVSGFKHSITEGFGSNLITNCRFKNVEGPLGAINLLYGCYVVEDNYAENISTKTIDGNMILLDHYVFNTIVRRNYCKNITGPGATGKDNNGAGVMVLDNCMNNWVYGNIFENCRYGIFFGDLGTQSSNHILNNSFINVWSEGIRVSSSSTNLIDNQVVINNLFIGNSTATMKVNDRMINGPTWTRGESHNYFYGFPAANVNHSLGSKSVASAATDGLNQAKIDSTSYMPDVTSPLRGKGKFAGYVTDFYGKPFKIPSTIGGVESFETGIRAKIN